MRRASALRAARPAARAWPRRARVDRLPPRSRMPVAHATRRCPATNSAAPALSSTTSRAGPARRRARRERCGVLRRRRRPTASAGAAFGDAELGRVNVERVHRAGAAFRHLRVAGRRESRRCRPRRGRPRRASEPSSSSARASSSVSSGRGTPTICRVAPAGFVNGPSRLNAVRMPSSRRVCAACFIDGMKRRREEERDVRVVAASARRPAGGAGMFDPERLEHIGAAAPARDRSVAMLGHRDAARRHHNRCRRLWTRRPRRSTANPRRRSARHCRG